MFVHIPGLHNSDADHWQSQFERRAPQASLRVLQDHWDTPECAAWVERIEATLAPLPHAALVLTGHSIGCMAIAHWAAKHGHVVKGALLVAPSDAEREGYPKFIQGFAPLMLDRLPFPSIVVGSTNDHVTSEERTRHFAECWGSRLVMLKDAGHIESKSGYGHWPVGWALMQELAGLG